jgi:hypothetical protein
MELETVFSKISQSHKYKYWIQLGGVAQVVELLPSKHEALHSNPSTAKINK